MVDCFLLPSNGSDQHAPELAGAAGTAPFAPGLVSVTSSTFEPPASSASALANAELQAAFAQH